MNYEIVPLKSVGTFVFGMSPKQVRHMSGYLYQSFLRTPSSKHPCDYFPEIGIFANYTIDGKLEAIEFATPARPILDSVSLLELGFDKVKSFLSAKDDAIEIEIDGVISRKLGVSFYAPFAKENAKENCESMMAFGKGYYD